MSVAILKFIQCLMGSQCRLERCKLVGNRPKRCTEDVVMAGQYIGLME